MLPDEESVRETVGDGTTVREEILCHLCHFYVSKRRDFMSFWNINSLW